MFRLTRAETGALHRSQSVTGSQKHRNPKFPPFAFTGHGCGFHGMPGHRSTVSRAA